MKLKISQIYGKFAVFRAIILLKLKLILLIIAFNHNCRKALRKQNCASHYTYNYILYIIVEKKFKEDSMKIIYIPNSN